MHEDIWDCAQCMGAQCHKACTAMMHAEKRWKVWQRDGYVLSESDEESEEESEDENQKEKVE